LKNALHRRDRRLSLLQRLEEIGSGGRVIDFCFATHGLLQSLAGASVIFKG
jgi:hypothetical protein